MIYGHSTGFILLQALSMLNQNLTIFGLILLCDIESKSILPNFPEQTNSPQMRVKAVDTLLMLINLP